MLAKSFLEKVIRVRRRLLKEQKSKRGSEAIAAFDRVSKWYAHWRPNERQVKKYIQNHTDEIRMIMPGTKANENSAWEKQLSEIINS